MRAFRIMSGQEHKYFHKHGPSGPTFGHRFPFPTFFFTQTHPHVLWRNHIQKNQQVRFAFRRSEGALDDEAFV